MMNMKTIFILLLAATTLSVHAEQTDTTIVLNYGEAGPVDTITISKLSATFTQLSEAEALMQKITDQSARNHAIINYVMQHPDSDGSVYLLNYLKGAKNGKKVLSTIGPKARSGVMKKLYDVFDAGMKSFDDFFAKTAEAFAIGQVPQDFSLEDVDGHQLSLSSLRGKYLLLDFWGSWCVNCIANFPRMKAFYQQHRDKLEILGVAIDDSKDKWKVAVKKHELPWKHVIDTDGAGNVKERYGISAAPTYVLIDPEGKVIEWNIGEFENIEEYFSQPK